MKKLIFTIVLLNSFFIYAQNVNIPDANFKNYLLNNPLVNTNSDNEIQVTEAIAFTGSLSFQFYSISNLTGIEAFVNLTFLDCGDNNLQSIDLSQNIALEQLYCYDNQLTSLNLSANTALQALDCRNNQITNLNLSNLSNLYYLQCTYNNMQSLNVQNTALQTLRCYSNNLTSLNLHNLNQLHTIVCNNNDFTELDLSTNTALTSFECKYSNALTTINIANTNNTSITAFDARYNSNLSCIQVDSESYSNTNWTNINGTTVFNEDCNSLSFPTSNLLLESFYPNPFRNNIVFQVLENSEFIIYSLKGKEIKKGKFKKGKNELQLESLAASVYILKVHTKNGKTAFTRFIKI